MKIKERGITLIALIVTIIILLILAGVTLNVTLSDNGLFNKSKQAVEKYKGAEAKEKIDMAIAEYMLEINSREMTEEEKQSYLMNLLKEVGTVTDVEESYEVIIDGETFLVDKKGQGVESTNGKITGKTTSEVKNKITGTETENTEVIIKGRKVVVPAGFTISEESAETVDGGIVVVDKVGNEWVWVPCTDFSRKAFINDDNITSRWTEAMPEDQNASVTKNKGYYIARYEAGNDGSDNIIIQKNKTPYKKIAIADCKTKSSSFAVDNGYDTNKMFTVLCSSYAWDSYLTFIEKTIPGYATNSPQGNYDDTNFVEGSNLLNTGLTTPVCNIYDMGGNLWEYTTESFSNTTFSPYVVRGGSYDSNASNGPAGYRLNFTNLVYYAVGFRPTLFLK